MSEIIFKVYYNPTLKTNIDSKFIRRNKKLQIKNCEIFSDKKNWDYVFSQIFQATTIKGGKDLCNGAIPKGFFDKESVDSDTSMIFIIESRLESRKRSFHMVGFSLCNDLNIESDKNGIYLDAICTRPRYGSILLDFIEKFAKEKRFDFIKLSSLAYVINYYRKRGYRHVKNCKNKEGEGYREEQISRMAELNSHKKFKDDDAIIEYEEDEDDKIIRKSIQEKDIEFVNFLKLLSSRGYGVNCSNHKDRPSKYRTYSFLDKKCMDEGFTMIKCFKKRKYTKRNLDKIKKTHKKSKIYENKK